MSSKEKAVSSNQFGPAAAATESNVNPYLAEALELKNRLRAILEAVPPADRTPLTPAELRLATITTVEALEQAALFAEEEPNVGGDLSDVPKLRDAINFLLAFEGVRDQARFVLGEVDHTVIRRKVDAAKYARGLYRVAKVYAKSAPDQRLQSKLEIMQVLFGRGRRKPAPKADPEAAVK